MIPTIGVMIGAYIFTRMAQMLSRTGDRKESSFTQVFAILTMIITALAIMSLIFGSEGISMKALVGAEASEEPAAAIASSVPYTPVENDFGEPVELKYRSVFLSSDGETAHRNRCPQRPAGAAAVAVRDALGRGVGSCHICLPYDERSRPKFD